MQQFESLLKQRMGLDSASIGSSVIERAVRLRQAACKLADEERYWQHLSSSDEELQQLIEEVVVPETWFFRDREAFAALGALVVPQWQARGPLGPLRLLSLPCSTGEEPYSAAMALLDAGLTVDRFAIDGVDISTRALELARLGVYGSNSFRGDDLAFRDRHFQPQADGYRVSDAVRASVQFRQANLFTADLGGPYDAIYCRNLLIYFDRATQDRAIQALRQLLLSDGFLFVGPSETGLLTSHGFVSARRPMAFAFRKGPVPPAKTAEPPMAAPAPRPRRPEPVKPAFAALPAMPPRDDPEGDLDRAQRLADQGHLAEAAKLCEQNLHRYGASARAYYLLGLIRDAAGEVGGAETYYRKALYLQPEHGEALTHLALLLETRGDKAGALLMRQRTQRRQESGS